jgi:DNA-binding NarL/FixJ family response regulator
MPTKVAIVEDSRTIRESLTRIIDDAPGLKCSCAVGSAEEALVEIPKCLPEVVLMDIHLPDMSGIECTLKLKSTHPEAQVIMLTVYEDNDSIFGALQAGACGYLLKRTRPEQLITAIHEVRQGGAPMNSEIARRVIGAFQRPADLAAPKIELTRREREILDWVSRGYGNKEIAQELSITVETVRHHLKKVYEKLHVHSRTEAVLRYLRAAGGTPPVGPLSR